MTTKTNKKENKMKKLVLMALLIATFTNLHANEGWLAILPPESVTKQTIREVMNEKYRTTIDDDGDVCVEADSFKFWIEIDRERKFIKLYTAFSEDSMTPDGVRDLLGTLNRERVFVKGFLAKTRNGELSIGLNYFMAYDGGLIKKNLLESTRWFVSVVSWWRDEWMKLEKKRN